MAFLDFIKNRQASQQPAVAEKTQGPKPETAKEMYTREAKEPGANGKSFAQLPPEKQADVASIKADLAKSTQTNQQAAPSNTPAAAEGSGSPQAMRQNATNQDKAAPSQSPTSAQMGSTQVEKKTAAPSQEPAGTPSKPSPTPASPRPQTLPRPRPSWER